MSAIDSLEPPMASRADTGTRRYAGFWIRVVAYLVDAVIVTVACFLMGFVGRLAGAVSGGYGVGSELMLNLFGIVIGAVYYVVFTASTWQATPGKRLLGIHVMQADGGPVGVGRAIGRYFANFLSAIILMIGYMMAGWTREKTALHDLVCSTRVVYGKAPAQ